MTQESTESILGQLKNRKMPFIGLLLTMSTV